MPHIRVNGIYEIYTFINILVEEDLLVEYIFAIDESEYNTSTGSRSDQTFHSVRIDRMICYHGFN